MAFVLVIDDNPDIAALVADSLGAAGHRVDRADSAETGVVAATGPPQPDLVLLDVNLPGRDGWFVLEALRSREETSSVPILMCTVQSELADLERGWSLGCDGYLSKPFDIAELRSTVRSLLACSADELAARREQVRQRLEPER